MHSAQVTEWGKPPKYVEVPDLPAPEPHEARVKVIASGLHRVVKSKAAGSHYTSAQLPQVPGMDGVGSTEDGQNVYFSAFNGSMTEYLNLPRKSLFPLPEGTDPVQIAGLANPAMSSWMAIKARTTNLPADFSILILGATTASGRTAIPLARSLGAKRVIGAARNKAALDTLGLDESIVIAENVGETDFSSVGDVDVVLDYVNGDLTQHFFASLKTTRPVQYVHVGSVSGKDFVVPSTILRSKDVTIRGAGPGSWSIPDFLQTLPDMLVAMKDIPAQPIKTVNLANVETEWESSSSERVVFLT